MDRTRAWMEMERCTWTKTSAFELSMGTTLTTAVILNDRAVQRSDGDFHHRRYVKTGSCNCTPFMPMWCAHFGEFSLPTIKAWISIAPWFRSELLQVPGWSEHITFHCDLEIPNLHCRTPASATALIDISDSITKSWMFGRADVDAERCSACLPCWREGVTCSRFGIARCIICYFSRNFDMTQTCWVWPSYWRVVQTQVRGRNWNWSDWREEIYWHWAPKSPWKLESVDCHHHGQVESTVWVKWLKFQQSFCCDWIDEWLAQ